MWDPNSPAKGKISPYDDAIYIADAAVYLMATQPDLKITNPYALDQTQFDAAVALVQQQKPLVAEYWARRGQAGPGPGLRCGHRVPGLAAHGEPGQRRRARRWAPPSPTEGATGWSDTWMIKKDTPNINCAYLWLNHVVSPEVNAQIAEFFGEAPANPKSCALTKNTDHCTQYHAEETDFWNNVYYWTTPVENCVDGRTDVKCVGYDEWVRAWSQLRSAVEQASTAVTISAGRRMQAVLHRRPGLRLTGLLAPALAVAGPVLPGAAGVPAGHGVLRHRQLHRPDHLRAVRRQRRRRADHAGLPAHRAAHGRRRGRGDAAVRAAGAAAGRRTWRWSPGPAPGRCWWRWCSPRCGRRTWSRCTPGGSCWRPEGPFGAGLRLGRPWCSR